MDLIMIRLLRCMWTSTLSLLLIGFGCTNSYAGVTASTAQDAKREAPAPAKSPASADESLDAIEKITSSGPKKPYVLRCWQNGILIVERPADGLPEDSAKVVRIAGKPHSDMRLFDLRNATCLLQ